MEIVVTFCLRLATDASATQPNDCAKHQNKTTLSKQIALREAVVEGVQR